MAHRIYIIPIALLMGMFSISCRQSQELAYISDAQRDSAQTIISTYSNTIHPGDQLYIYVYSQTPESVVPFNQETRVFSANVSRNINEGEANYGDVDNTTRITQADGYIVTEEGFITFPVVGKLIAVGLTQDSLAHAIELYLIEGGYINDPIVTISPMNFRVSVVGEVNDPHELHITGERLTIFEALAMCGDLTIYGQRENVTVLREINGQSTPIQVDLTKKALFDSPVYYLQNNDIVYIEPNTVKRKESFQDELWPKRAEFWVAVGTAVYSISRASLARFRHD